MSYFVYITTNPRKTVLYTGVTNDLKRRLKEHRKNRDTGQTFAGEYHCHKCIYYESFESITVAIAREKEIKNMSREKKFELIKKVNPELVFYIF